MNHSECSGQKSWNRFSHIPHPIVQYVLSAPLQYIFQVCPLITFAHTIFIQTSILTGLSATILPLSLRPKQHAKEWSHYNRSLICHCTKTSVLSHLAWSKRKVPAKFSMTRSMLPLWAQSPSPVPFQSPWPPYSFQNKSVRPGHILLFLPELLFLQIFMWLKHHHIYKVFPDHLFFLL